MNKYQYLNKIVIEATKEWPKPPIIGYDAENDFDYYDSDFLVDPSSLHLSGRRTLEICDIDLNQWKVTMHSEYIERFRKVAAVVGEDKALEVLKALDG